MPDLEADHRLKPTTKSCYRVAAKHLVRHAGRVALGELRGDHIDHVLAVIAGAGRSLSMRHHVRVCAHKALADAVRWRLVPYNAAADSTPTGRPRSTPTAWTPPQVGAFLEASSTDRWTALWRVLAVTGKRRGEAVALRWSNVDLDTATITVAENHPVAHGRFRHDEGRPRARHLIDLPTVAALRSWRSQQSAELLRLGEYRSAAGDHCWTWEDGRILHPNIVTRTFNRIRDRAGLPPLRLHGLRHSWATAALTAKVDLLDVSRRLGHPTHQPS